MIQGGVKGKRDGVGGQQKKIASSIKQFRFILRCCNCLPEGLTASSRNYLLNIDIANILSASH